MISINKFAESPSAWKLQVRARERKLDRKCGKCVSATAEPPQKPMRAGCWQSQLLPLLLLISCYQANAFRGLKPGNPLLVLPTVPQNLEHPCTQKNFIYYSHIIILDQPTLAICGSRLNSSPSSVWSCKLDSTETPPQPQRQLPTLSVASKVDMARDTATELEFGGLSYRKLIALLRSYPVFISSLDDEIDV